MVRAGAARSSLVVLGLAVTALFTYLAVRGVRFADVWDALREANKAWLVPAFAALALAVFLRAVRWRALFVQETRPPLPSVARALLVGYFFNNILPLRAGEAARVLALNRSAGTSRAEATAIVILERALDVFTILVLFFCLLPWLPHVSWVTPAAVLAGAVAFGFALAVVALAVFGDAPLRLALRPLVRLRLLSAERAGWAVRNLEQGLAALRRPEIAFGAFFWTAVSWLALALSNWLLLRGFDLGLSFVAGALVVVTTNLALILPSSPAGLGVFEAATLVALRAYGVPDSRALSYALLLHALNFLPYIAAGLFVLHREALRPRRGTLAR